MKKILVVLCVAGFIVSLASPLMAGGIINKQNLSSEYLRTFSRNAATDAADVTVYNPAGVMKMENGCYGNLGLFYAQKKYNDKIASGLDPGDYDSDEPSIVPGLFLLHKQDKWAGFFALTIPGGGGKVDYKDGSSTTYAFTVGAVPSSLEAESVYKGYTIGGAYAVNDMVSVAAGLRFVDAFKEATAEVPLAGETIDYEQTADGWGGFLGVNYSPREDLNFGFRFETATKLDFEWDIKQDTTGLYSPLDGSKEREDLPGLIGLGVAYKVKPNLKLDVSLTYYLEKNAKFEDGSRLEDEGDSWDLAISAEYTFNPQLRGSVGYMLTKTGIDPDNMLPENPELGANSICAGVAWEPKENMTLNFAMLNTFYVSDSGTFDTPPLTPVDVEYEKNVFGVAFGIEYKFK
jgi:long-chain fatty acid transport protein